MGKIFRDATPEQEQAFIEERRKSAFVDACKSPFRWLYSARHHKRAADILYEIAYTAHQREMARMVKEMERIRAEMAKQGLSSPSESRTLEGEELSDSLDSELLGDYLLLAGYALECVLKACLLAMRPELVKDDKKLDNLVLTHNLAKLCDNCAIVVSPQERYLLDIMTWHSDWGRYLVPKDLKDMPSPVDPTPISPYAVSAFHNRHEKTTVDRLYESGCALLETLRQSKTQPGPQ